MRKIAADNLGKIRAHKKLSGCGPTATLARSGARIAGLAPSCALLFLSFCLLIMCFSLSVNGQVRKTFKFEIREFTTNVLAFEKFPVISVDGVSVKKSKGRGEIPTIYSLETPKVKKIIWSNDLKQLKAEWVAKHPKSSVIEVHHYPLMSSQGMNYGQHAFVWIISDDEIFNIELVRNGACEAQTMLLDKEDETYILIPRYIYDEVRNRLVQAEKEAKEKHLGIWKNK